MLKGGAAVGAAVVWAVPVVEVLTTASASASGQPLAYKFPSWAYVIYTTATNAAGLSASTVLSAGFTSPGIPGNAANPSSTQQGTVTPVSLGTITLSLGVAQPGPAPVTVTPPDNTKFLADSATGSVDSATGSFLLQEAAGVISPTSGSDITILGAFAFAGAYATAYGSKLVFFAAVDNQVQLPSG